MVVLDVMMPGTARPEVCRKIREAVSLAHTGVVMLTGIGEHLNEMIALPHGADAYAGQAVRVFGAGREGSGDPSRDVAAAR
ncbi:MAG: hypothetical protein U0263_36515 [Polyangiaceae bacterium]